MQAGERKHTDSILGARFLANPPHGAAPPARLTIFSPL